MRDVGLPKASSSPRRRGPSGACERKTLGSRFRGNDGALPEDAGFPLPRERRCLPKDAGFPLPRERRCFAGRRRVSASAGTTVLCRKTLGSRFRGNDGALPEDAGFPLPRERRCFVERRPVPASAGTTVLAERRWVPASAGTTVLCRKTPGFRFRGNDGALPKDAGFPLPRERRSFSGRRRRARDCRRARAWST